MINASPLFLNGRHAVAIAHVAAAIRAALPLAAIALSFLAGRRAVADAPEYAEHADLSYLLDADGEKHPIGTVDEWMIRRGHILAHVQEVMGPMPRPASPVPLAPTYEGSASTAGVVRRRVTYHTDSSAQTVSAWLFVPQEPKDVRKPAVLCLHQTTLLGKDEPAGLGGSDHLHYAMELADRGFVTLAPDYPSLGEYAYDFANDGYESGSMKAIYDNVRALDLLESMDEVDPQRIGCIGHSLGGHNAIFTAVFDHRLKAIVSCCGFTSFHRYQGGDLTGWSGPRYMPRIASRYHNRPDAVPFDFTELVAALAPRAFLAVAPLRDDNFDVQGVKEIMAAAQPIYRLYGRATQLEADYPDARHDFPDASRLRAYDFLELHLSTDSTEP